MWNVGMCAVFGFFHSFMISQAFKNFMVAIWGGFAVWERTIFVWFSALNIIAIFYYYQPVPIMIVDYYSPCTLAISYFFVAFYIVNLTYCNGLLGQNDLFGFGRFAVMDPKGFEHPFNLPLSDAWLYKYTTHPIYWHNAIYFLTQGTTLTYGRLAISGSLFVYNFIGACIETWRFKDVVKDPKKTYSALKKTN
jgi:hypothetical protein